MSGKSWLDDDPEWQQLKARIEGRKIEDTTQSHRTAHNNAISNHTNDEKSIKDIAGTVVSYINPIVKKTTIISSIYLQRARRKIASFYNKNRRYKHAILTAGILLVVVPLGFAMNNRNKAGTIAVDGNGVLSQQTQKPEYNVLAPQAISANDESRGVVRYDSQRKVASFSDTIGVTPITVSMQPLPDAFKSDPAVYVEKLATDFYADQKINESNPVAFSGKNVETGIQTTIFSKNGLLVFIIAQQEIDKHDLATYITALE